MKVPKFIRKNSRRIYSEAEKEEVFQTAKRLAHSDEISTGVTHIPILIGNNLTQEELSVFEEPFEPWFRVQSDKITLILGYSAAKQVDDTVKFFKATDDHFGVLVTARYPDKTAFTVDGSDFCVMMDITLGDIKEKDKSQQIASALCQKLVESGVISVV